MAKRFTDTEKWKKPFIRGMKAPYKLLWLYMLDECDHAGIWQVDFDVAQIKIGEKLDQDKALEFFKDKIVVINDGEKWFIPDFIDFQYGELNPANRAHSSVLNILKKNNLLDENLKLLNKPLTSPLQGAMDKDKDMDKEQANDPKPEATQIPSLPHGEDFAKAWGDWLVYRKERKLAKYTPIGLSRLLNQLAGYSESICVACINKSITSNWQGLFPEQITQHDLTKVIKTTDDKSGRFNPQLTTLWS